MDCIFCKINNKEIPAYTIYEDDHVHAFLDISQGTKGHTLIIPKKHIKNLYELDEETANHLFKVIPKIANALKKAFNPIGLNMINNNDKPLQSVFHFHIHLVPRYENDDLALHFLDNQADYSEDDYKQVARSIAEKLK